jgi:hypothetical protein
MDEAVITFEDESISLIGTVDNLDDEAGFLEMERSSESEESNSTSRSACLARFFGLGDEGEIFGPRFGPRIVVRGMGSVS